MLYVNMIGDDSFIGLDIEIEPERRNVKRPGAKTQQSTKKVRDNDSKTPSSLRSGTERRSKGQKRQRTSQQREDDAKAVKKPKPPPDPPASLVSLLRNDAKVLSYFRSLHENLEYDVEKWKREAKRWKLLATAESNHSGRRPSTRKEGRKKKQERGSIEKQDEANDSSATGKDLNLSRERKASRQDEGSTVPITDEALFGELDCEDDGSQSSNNQDNNRDNDQDDNQDNNQDMHQDKSQDITLDNNQYNFQDKNLNSSLSGVSPSSHNRNKIDTKQNGKEGHNTPTNHSPRHHQQETSHLAANLLIVQKLKEAKNYLDQLGVSLVEVEIKIVSTDGDNELIISDAPAGPVEPQGHVDSFNKSNSPTDEVPETPLNPNTQLKDRKQESPVTIVCEKTLHRQSDEKVAADMMASLRTLIKASSLIGAELATSNDDDDFSDPTENDSSQNDTATEEDHLNHEERIHRTKMRRQFHPFCRDGHLHLPNVYPSPNPINDSSNPRLPPHPSSVGLRYLISILSIMDVYCRDDLDDDTWNEIFTDAHESDEQREETMILCTGMRNRCRLAQRILSTLDVEITQTWATTDRAAFLSTPTIHFHPADVMQPEEPLSCDFYGAKSYNRLTLLEERIAHARMATLTHRRHGDWQKAAELVVGFIVSSAPSLGVERYPKLPPVLSLCILEALLSSNDYVPENSDRDGSSDMGHRNLPSLLNQGWFYAYILHLLHDNQDWISLLFKALAFPVHVAANIWRERSLCTDDRIRDVALIELAAYHRLQQLTDGNWLNCLEVKEDAASTVGSAILSSAVTTLLPSNDSNNEIITPTSTLVSGISCILALISLGDVGRIAPIGDQIISLLTHKQDSQHNYTNKCIFFLPICCSAYTSIMNWRWESMKLGDVTGRHTAAAFTIEDTFSPILESVTQLVDPNDWCKMDAILQCYVLLGDGLNLLKLANQWLPNMTKILLSNNTALTQRKVLSRVMAMVIDAGEIPTVRVINLQRRPDRLLDFMGHALREQLIVIKGPAKLRHKSYLKRKPNKVLGDESLESTSNIAEDLLGDFAFDGQCSHEELDDQVSQRLASTEDAKLSDFVRVKWRPGDLRAFDKEARLDSELVPVSVTERACALSHIASWIGVEGSLTDSKIVSECHDGWYQQKLQRMFQLAGFARGQPLLPENETMTPVPVCVILEDDAVLSDRFSERLASLLEELPRDFHFCSLGYSKPKTAPMVEYSSQLGIPSCLWYLTGYVLSLEGARFLIQSLPVVGPVDSWMGMKMCANWENMFGQWIGVGKYAKAKSKIPSRKDLAKILKFRAFAALVPLCAQKVGTVLTTALTRVSWRDRDTDITYSG